MRGQDPQMTVAEINPDRFKNVKGLLKLSEMTPLEQRVYDSYFGARNSLGMADIWDNDLHVPAVIFAKYISGVVEQDLLGQVFSFDSYLEARRGALVNLAVTHWATKHLSKEVVRQWRSDMVNLLENESYWLARWVFDATGLAMRRETDELIYSDDGGDYQTRLDSPHYPEQVASYLEKFLPDSPSKTRPADKIIASRSFLVEEVSRFREQGFRVATFFGGFDIKHAGHGETAAKIKSLGPHTKLVVVLAPDNEMRLLKGEDRPYQSLPERSSSMSHDQAVDLVYAPQEGPEIDFSSDGSRFESCQRVAQWYEQLHTDVAAHIRVVGQAGVHCMSKVFLEECRRSGTMLLAIDGGQSISTTSLVERIRRPDTK